MASHAAADAATIDISGNVRSQRVVVVIPRFVADRLRTGSRPFVPVVVINVFVWFVIVFSARVRLAVRRRASPPLIRPASDRFSSTVRSQPRRCRSRFSPPIDKLRCHTPLRIVCTVYKVTSPPSNFSAPVNDNEKDKRERYTFG